MRRFFEFLVIICTLIAIASTFLLYRFKQATADQSASVVETLRPLEVAPDLSTKPQTEIIATKEIAIDTPSTTPAAKVKLEAKVEPVGKVEAIVIEKAPLEKFALSEFASNIHTLTNVSRSQNNLPALAMDSALAILATKRSQDMIDKRYFSHTSPDGCDLSCRFKSSGYQTLSWGENLAESEDYRQFSAQTLASSFIEGWLRSSTHRENLLAKKFTHQGIGVAESGDRVVVTVIFARP